MSKQPKAKQFTKKLQAFTIMEAMVAISILSITGFGALTGLLQARKMTEGSIYVATSTNVAQGYIEQLKSMDFRFLDEAVIEDLMSQGAADSLSVSPLPSNFETGNADTDIVNSKWIDINNTPTDAGDDLKIDIFLYIDDTTDEANGIGDSRKIVLRWEYLDNSSGTDVPVSNTLYTIRSRVPTF
ncbi:type IV pilus modification PilV family protein [Pelagicoccus albus]|uniref:Prepilin-type N-terminal cleavage/methylation domain-containing protein n=1 Tax=Pelagicoccus albus TaxID=415222 RepID=A0A7X1B513_9BACT|nr:hypothetical protein [Pelagicoccus albus]MBC2604663.1 hypothetical protein [Pelagicoccus albus]